ncbi:GTP cyclohydrolase II [Pedococcus bigeumensis]|uniref:GTP cyclohydrolase II n=1 Tax=Pedococcus bigeumensis TaxID=433644 RepID=A0A502D5U2_9MICO|nr:GTP cyclohydrolase II [Pedococcus bigeumensis]TPG19361.1 GTP cyclohydrolase II [Pedococcus bigeumensis]
MSLPAAVLRAQVSIPLTLHDGFETTARAFTFTGLVDGREHIALGLGGWADQPVPASALVNPPLTRLHSECLTGDVLGSRRCDCGPQLQESLRRLADEGGLLLYLRQEGRGIGLYAKLDAYLLQDDGLDTYEANLALGYDEDERDYLVAAQMLAALGVHRVALLTNNADKVAQLTRLGVDVVQRVPTGVHRSDANGRYLATKLLRGRAPS